MTATAIDDRPANERSPESIASDTQLGPREKIRLLRDLILDLEAELRASEESMTSPKPGRAGDRLQRANRQLLALTADCGEGDS